MSKARSARRGKTWRRQQKTQGGNRTRANARSARGKPAREAVTSTNAKRKTSKREAGRTARVAKRQNPRGDHGQRSNALGNPRLVAAGTTAGKRHGKTREAARDLNAAPR